MSALTININLGSEGMQTPKDLAAALRQLADDMDNKTAGSPSEPIELTENTRIAGNIWSTAGPCVGYWRITP